MIKGKVFVWASHNRFDFGRMFFFFLLSFPQKNTEDEIQERLLGCIRHLQNQVKLVLFCNFSSTVISKAHYVSP